MTLTVLSSSSTTSPTSTPLSPTYSAMTQSVPGQGAHQRASGPSCLPPPRPVPGDVPAGPNPTGAVPCVHGQLILVSLAQQELWAYQDHKLVYRTAITSGMPHLETPTGQYHIQYHESGVYFTSPWPKGSPYYYAPIYVDYALYFEDWGFFIHDAPWRDGYFGPGTNVPHTDPDGVQRTGSHGCVEVSKTAGAWLYSWTNDGATLDITPS